MSARRGARLRRALVALGLAWLLSASLVPGAAGHAFGPFSISVYSGLVVHDDRIEIRWVLDMAEIPASATVELIDSDGNGRVTDAEKSAYFDLWVSSVLAEIQLTVDGQELPKEVVARELTLPAGEGGSPALRVVMDLASQLPVGPASEERIASYRDTNYADYVGWREVAVAAHASVQLVSSSAPTEGRTNELTVFPADLGVSVPTSEADFTFVAAPVAAPAAGSSGGAPQPPIPASAPPSSGPTFSFWPTGVLALVAVAGLAAVLIAANRRETTRPRR